MSLAEVHSIENVGRLLTLVKEYIATSPTHSDIDIDNKALCILCTNLLRRYVLGRRVQYRQPPVWLKRFQFLQSLEIFEPLSFCGPDVLRLHYVPTSIEDELTHIAVLLEQSTGLCESAFMECIEDLFVTPLVIGIVLIYRE